MTHEDPTLQLWTMPLMRPDPLDFARAPLHFDETAGTPVSGAHAFVLTGRRAVVTARDDGSVRAELDGIRAIADLTPDSLQPISARVTSVGVERTWNSTHATLCDRIFVPADLPACLFEWSAQSDAPMRLAFTTDLATADAVHRHLRWHASPTLLVITSDARRGDATAACFHTNTPVTWIVEDASDDECARARIICTVATDHTVHPRDASDRFRLVATAAHGTVHAHDTLDAMRDTLDAMRDPLALLRSRLAEQSRLAANAVALTSDDSAMDTFVAWAKVRLHDAPLEREPMRAAIVAIAALAAGDSTPARRAIAAIRTADFTPAAARWYLLTLARCHAWTADTPFVKGEWEHAHRAVNVLRTVSLEDAADSVDGVLHVAALSEIANTAEDVGDRVLASFLHSEAKQQRIRLAVRSVERSPAVLRMIAALGLLEEETAAHRLAHTAFFDGVIRDFQTQRSGGVTENDSIDSRSAMALTLAFILIGAWGVHPDAARGRLRIRPVLPAHWRSARLDNFRLGDAAVSVDFQRGDAGWVYRITQSRGAVPLRLVFEPVLALEPGSLLSNATVDGVEASLDPRPFEDRLLVPLQIMLDADRVIRLTHVKNAPAP